MGLFVVAGAQYGSEGKGKVANYLASAYNAIAVVRVGGCNAGHTVYIDNEPCICRVIPAAALTSPDCYIVLPAGSYVNLNLLSEEIQRFNIDIGRILIDDNAVIMHDSFTEDERQRGSLKDIASTLSGTGAAVEARIRRDTATILAKYVNCPYNICDTKQWLTGKLKRDFPIVVEGSQGYMLSVLHTPYYPCCTSRDTSINGILSEVGVSYKYVDKTIGVYRTYPIRVGGTSGPLPRETTWDTVTRKSGSPKPLIEYTSVTKRVRRVAELDEYEARMVYNNELYDYIALNHMDYIDYSCHDSYTLSIKANAYLEHMERIFGRMIDFVGTGSNTIIQK